MADVTISQLTQGTPAGNNILPYSNGQNTLGVQLSAIFFNTSTSIGMGYRNDAGDPVPAGVFNLGSASSGRALAWGSVANNYSNIFGSYSGGSLVLGTNTLGGIDGGTSSLSGDKYYSSYNNSGTVAPARRNIIRLNTFNDNGIQFFTNPGEVLERGVEFTPLERMRIDASGRVTKPFQPAFHVWNQVNQTLTNNTVMQFDAATSNSARVFNQGGHYANGRFTAPVAGLYQFSVNVLMNSAVGGDARYIGFVLNGTDLLDYAYVYAGQTYQSFNVSATIKLAATNYIEVRAFGTGATMNMDNSGTFSGHLVG